MSRTNESVLMYVQGGPAGREHIVLLADGNAAGAKGLPKPERLAITSQGEEKCTVLVQRFDCLARCVDCARIAANGLEVLQVLSTAINIIFRTHIGRCTRKNTLQVASIVRCEGKTTGMCVQMAWHPHSASHFATLTSDNAFCVFSIRQLSTPEQLFKINPLRPCALSISALSVEDSCMEGPQELVAFSFGSAAAWDPLMVYFMTRCCTNEPATKRKKQPKSS